MIQDIELNKESQVGLCEQYLLISSTYMQKSFYFNFNV